MWVDMNSIFTCETQSSVLKSVFRIMLNNTSYDWKTSGIVPADRQHITCAEIADIIQCGDIS